ncbi:S9 family peptidase [Myroides sp. LJL115]
MEQIKALQRIWHSKSTIEQMPLDIVIDMQDINKDQLQLKTVITLGEQEAIEIQASQVAFDDNCLTFSIEKMQMDFKLTLVKDTLKGEVFLKQQAFDILFHPLENSLPGDPTLVSSVQDLQKLQHMEKQQYKYKVSDYFERPDSFGFQLSPQGKYLSFKKKDEKGKAHVYIKDIDKQKVSRVIQEDKELIRGYGWLTEQRLVYIMDKGGDENYHIYAVDVDGSNAMDLTPYPKVKANILNLLKEDQDHIIISLNLDNPQVFEPYKLNIHNAQMVKLFENKQASTPISSYDFDKDGNLRGYSQMLDGIKTQYFYKAQGKSEFSLYHTIDWCDTFAILSFDYSNENKDAAYVLTNLDSDKLRIVLWDFATNTAIKTIYENPDYDVSILGLSRLRNWEIDYVGYIGSKLTIEPVSETYKQIHQDLTQYFTQDQYSIADKTDKEDKYLVFVQSDTLYGSYYFYDKQSRKITLLYDLMPQLERKDMATMLPISFTSRDNITLHGYITLPQKALDGQKVALIVNPHGGPQGIRDSWGFNPEAQLFASRDMATLQVNFRISGGYGKEFFTSGFKQIGRKVMDDIEDGVAYCIAQGWIDPDRIAIYGASHGGYATLMGLIKTPDLYRCGVDYVGVSSIFTFFDSFPEYWKPYKEMVKQIWYDLDDPKEREIAKLVSPIYQLDKISKPLFVVQGANDPRVKIGESDQIVKALRQKGFDVPYMVKYDEGHGFGKEQNRIEFYQCMMGFFSEHLSK